MTRRKKKCPDCGAPVDPLYLNVTVEGKRSFKTSGYAICHKCGMAKQVK